MVEALRYPPSTPRRACTMVSGVMLLLRSCYLFRMNYRWHVLETNVRTKSIWKSRRDDSEHHHATTVHYKRLGGKEMEAPNGSSWVVSTACIGSRRTAHLHGKASIAAMLRVERSFLRPWHRKIFGSGTRFLAWPAPTMTSTCSSVLRSLQG
jgi:hypothetical protein